MQSISLPELFELSLPVVAMLVSYGIQKDTFTKQMNAAIAATTIIIVAVMTVIVNGQITGNTAADLILITGAATTLQLHSFSVLDVYLRSNFNLDPSALLNKSSKGIGTNTPAKPPQSD